jgi:hypothetical protein
LRGRLLLLLRLLAADHPGLAVALAVGSPGRERAGEVVVVQAAALATSELLERGARHRPGEMVVVEAPAQHRERKRERKRGERETRRDK